MKKTFFLSIFSLFCFFSKAQLNPVSHLAYNSAYNYPAYSNCPQYSCFYLTWFKPDTLTNDTLLGYNVYQNDVFFAFAPDTIYGCQYINICSPSAANWFVNVPFWITVKAVYDKDSVTSVANDSILISSFPIDIAESNEKKHFTVCPSPFSSQATVHTDKILKEATLSIYNQMGEPVKQLKNLNGQTIILQRDNLREGFYFIRLSQNDKIIATDKLIIVGNQ